MRSQTQRATKTAMNLTEWKKANDVQTLEQRGGDADDVYYWRATKQRPNGGTSGFGTTEFAACYALARKLEVEPPEEMEVRK